MGLLRSFGFRTFSPAIHESYDRTLVDLGLLSEYYCNPDEVVEMVRKTRDMDVKAWRETASHSVSE